jgi:putative transposase
VTYSWVRPGERKRIPYENPQRRRLNVLAATVEWTDQTDLRWLAVRRSFDAVDLVYCLEQLADPNIPTVVVLDNAGFHHARLVRETVPELQRQRVYLYYLPPYSPELNAIERLFRVIKHHELPERSYRTFDALQEAVHDAFTRYEATHCHQPAYDPRLAA